VREGGGERDLRINVDMMPFAPKCFGWYLLKAKTFCIAT
jgi:hypothetical protein